MGFGIFKKLKDSFKKIKPWLNKTIPKVREAINKAKPITTTLLNEVPKYTNNEKVKNLFEKSNDILDLTSSGLELTDDVINKKKNINDSINWVNYNLAPRLKKY